MKKAIFNSIYKRRNFKKDLFIIASILIMPFIIYLHNFFPSEKEINNGFLIITSTYYEDIQTWAWVVLGKLLYVIIIAIWFMTCKHWWRYFLLLPQIFFAVQLISAFNDDLRFMDDFNIVYGILLSLPIAFFTYYMGTKINYYSFNKSIYDELNMEIDLLLEDLSRVKTRSLKSIQTKFIQLQKNRESLDKREYLIKLLELKNEINK